MKIRQKQQSSSFLSVNIAARTLQLCKLEAETDKPLQSDCHCSTFNRFWHTCVTKEA